MAMTPLDEIRHSSSHVLATATGWSMLDRKDGYSLEPAKK